MEEGNALCVCVEDVWTALYTLLHTRADNRSIHVRVQLFCSSIASFLTQSL